jgi:hypothetical protein
VLAGRTSFEKKCSLRGDVGATISALTDRVSADNTIDGLAEAKKSIDACIYAARGAGLAETDVQAFIKRSNEFSRDNNTRLNKFALARKAFTAGTSDSTMAIAVAVVQDAFILVLKLLSDIFGREARPRRREATGSPLDISDRDYDGPEIRAAKAILPPDVRDNVKALVNRFVRQGGAHVDRKGNYLIDNTTIREIETEVRNLSQTARPSDMAPRSATTTLRRNEKVEVANTDVNAGPDASIDQDAVASGRNAPRRGPSALVRQYLSSSAGATKGQPVPGRPAAPAPRVAPNTDARQAQNGPVTVDEGAGGIRFDRLRARRQNIPES